MEQESQYSFLGGFFLEHVDERNFKERVTNELDYSTDSFNIPKAYEEITENKPKEKRTLDKILFESILYGNLANIYLDKLTRVSQIDESDLIKLMENFIERVNYGKLDEALEKYMSPKGFYLMEAISNTELGNFFLAGFDYTKNSENKISTIRMLFSTVVPFSIEKKGYFISGLEIDFEKQISILLFRNMDNTISSEFEDIKRDTTTTKYYEKIKSLVYPILGVSNSIDYKRDRTAMFKMCKELDEIILKEFREDMLRKLGEDEIDLKVTSMLQKLLPQTILPVYEQRQVLAKRVQALILATYINALVDNDDLISIAKERKLVGFPTNISFKSGNSSKSATGTSVKDIPISGEIMFHSLYTDFDESLELPQWSISWFKDYLHVAPINTDVVQTTIRSTSKYLLIVFKNRQYLNEGLIKHVVNYANRYRNQRV
ncbi:hypothetical protein [Rossellomorea sp. RS05]|uniref:hypothetical protein n=1 Tax=Rossellomorea sp. RS05 TaxID=3149166 RepID=UPI0032221492